jgi:branched-chain amino acid transport system ATP-binding protein
MGLAPIVVDEIFGFLERLAKEGASLLLVEQYATRALDLADYVYILTRGTVTFAGEPAELEDESLFRHYIAG